MHVPIYSAGSADAAELESSAWAGSGIASSLAAAAAAMLRENPTQALPGRFVSALRLARTKLNELRQFAVDHAELLRDPTSFKNDPQSPMAHFATYSDPRSDRVGDFAEMLEQLVQQLDSLIDAPDVATAAEVEKKFRAFSIQEMISAKNALDERDEDLDLLSQLTA